MKIILKLDIIKDFYISDDLIIKSIDTKISQILIKLRPYIYSHCGDEVSFVACNTCIRDDVKSYFTYYPSGWSENIKIYTNIRILSYN